MSNLEQMWRQFGTGHRIPQYLVMVQRREDNEMGIDSVAAKHARKVSIKLE